MMNNIDIIISRYNEDLKWTLEEPFNKYKYIVYNKGVNDNFEKTKISKVINVKNVGRCDHTYLYHIVTNYENLNDITIFFPGSLDLPTKKTKAIKILKKINENNKAIFIGDYCNDIFQTFKYFKLDEWSCTHEKNKLQNNESKLYRSHLRPFGLWYRYYFGNKKVNYYTFNSIFSIDKKDIIQHPIGRYIKLLNQLRLSSNPEIGHYVERSWAAIFHPLNHTKFVSE